MLALGDGVHRQAAAADDRRAVARARADRSSSSCSQIVREHPRRGHDGRPRRAVGQRRAHARRPRLLHGEGRGPLPRADRASCSTGPTCCARCSSRAPRSDRLPAVPCLTQRLLLVLLLLTGCTNHRAPAASSTRITYRVTDSGGATTEQVTDVQGAYRARTTTTKGGHSLGGFLWDENGLYTVAADGTATQSERRRPRLPRSRQPPRRSCTFPSRSVRSWSPGSGPARPADPAPAALAAAAGRRPVLASDRRRPHRVVRRQHRPAAVGDVAARRLGHPHPHLGLHHQGPRIPVRRQAAVPAAHGAVGLGREAVPPGRPRPPARDPGSGSAGRAAAGPVSRESSTWTPRGPATPVRGRRLHVAR